MSSIICGNCKTTHESVEQVKACYEGVVVNDTARPVRHIDSVTTVDKLPWVPEDSGIYKNSLGIFKVYKALNGTHMLCKQLVIEDGVSGFLYRGGPRRFVKHDQRITLEEAKEFGTIYGVCAMCGRTLTDETSIANGIGPICASKVSF